MIINQVQLGGIYFEVRPKIGHLLLDYKTSEPLSPITSKNRRYDGKIGSALGFYR